MNRLSKIVRPLFLVLFAAIIVAWIGTPGRTASPGKSAFKVGDKVEVEFGETVEGEVTAINPHSGWVTVRVEVNGHEMSPTLPPERLKLVKKKAPPAAKSKKSDKAKEDSGDEDSKAPAPPAALSPSRTWSDVSGTHKIEAQFVELKDGKVTLKKANGSTIEVELEKLSEADRKEAKKLAEKSAAENPFEAPENPFGEDGKKTRRTKEKAEGSDDSSDDDSPSSDKSAAPSEKKVPAGDWSEVKQIMIDLAPSGKVVPDALADAPLDKLRTFSYTAQELNVKRDFHHLGLGGLFFDRKHQQAVLSFFDHFGELGQKLDCLNLKTGKLASSVVLETKSRPTDLSPDGSMVVCMPEGHDDKHGLEIWKLQKKPALVAGWIPDMKDDFFTSSEKSALFVTDEQVLTYDGWNNNLTLWNIKGAKAVYSLKLEKQSMPGLSSNRKLMALAGESGPVVLDALTGETLIQLPGDGTPGKFAFRPDGRQLACLSTDGLRIWDLEKKTLLREVWLAKEVPHLRLDWIDDDHLLAGGVHLLDVSKRIVLWEYHPQGNSIAVPIDGKLCYVITQSSQRQKYFVTQTGLFYLALPHPEAVAMAKSLTDDKLLAVKPGMEVSLNLNIPGTPEEVQKVTEKINAMLKENDIKVVPGAPIALEAAVEQGETKTESYHSFGGFGGGGGNQTVSVTAQISRISIKENGKAVWERKAQTGGFTPGMVTHKEGESIQQAVDKMQGTPLNFFMNAHIPKYVARPAEKGAYGTSLLTPQGPTPMPEKL